MILRWEMEPLLAALQGPSLQNAQICKKRVLSPVFTVNIPPRLHTASAVLGLSPRSQTCPSSPWLSRGGTAEWVCKHSPWESFKGKFLPEKSVISAWLRILGFPLNQSGEVDSLQTACSHSVKLQFLEIILMQVYLIKITVDSVLQVCWRKKKTPNWQKLSSNSSEKSVQYHNRVSNKSLYQFTWLGLSTECIFIDSFLWGWYIILNWH